MIRTNLSTRPFYNERAVHIALAAAAVVVLALTTINVVRIGSLSRQNAELSRRINRDRSEAEQRTRIAGEIRRGIDRQELQLIVDSAREANALIDQRTFSWTAFFNRIESTIPPDAMLSSVRPTVKEGQTHVSMVVLGRTAEDIDEFMEKLEATGAFEDVVPSQQDRTESGLYRVVVDSIYTNIGDEPTEARPAATLTPASASRKAGGAL